MSTKKTMKRTGSRIVWFEIPADNVARARKFYGSLFGWKIKAMPGMKGYWHIDTGGGDESLDGGMMARRHPYQPPVNYVLVDSVDKSAAKVKKLGGKICVSKTEVAGMGQFIICQDTEKNSIALWEMSKRTK